jgi:oxalate decarboxylase
VKGERPAGGADGNRPHLFHLAEAAANVFPAGGLQGAPADNCPIIRVTEWHRIFRSFSPERLREPHWHPSAWGLNFVLQGRALWMLVGPGGAQDEFEASKGDLVFAPQGHPTTSKCEQRRRPGPVIWF